LPVWSLWAMGVTIPFVELAGGFLVLVGLFTTAGLSMLGAVLCVVTFGHLLHEPLYALHEHVIPRLALTVLVLALPRAWDRFSVGAWRGRRGSARAAGGRLAAPSAAPRQRAQPVRERRGQRLSEHRVEPRAVGALACEVGEQPLRALRAARAQRGLVVLAHQPVGARPALRARDRQPAPVAAHAQPHLRHAARDEEREARDDLGSRAPPPHLPARVAPSMTPQPRRTS